ncbi:MAG TPA: hypothetical protein VJ438_00215 [Candidatus Nanoarchaeia archaeon]|nr:hypothetical protein [Candidatus Nanoarchaeia archaeon]
MTEDFKFKKVQEIVLYNITRMKKLCSVKDIQSFTGDTLSEKQIYNALENLERRKLIIKIKKKTDFLAGLNIKELDRIKKIIGVHWEANWEEDWKRIIGGLHESP